MCSPGHKGHDDLTSSPPSSRLSLAVSPECPAEPLATEDRGLRSLRDLTQHLTTRADDNHAPPVSDAPKRGRHYSPVIRMSRPGKVLRVCFELNHMLHRLCGSPSIPLSFILANVLPRWTAYCVSCGTEWLCHPTPSSHRLRRGLPGYLILFAPHAFEPQRQLLSSKPPSPLVFLLISTHFTATLGIPLTSQHSRTTVSKAVPGLSPGFSLQTCCSVYAPFTPSKSG